MEEFLGFLKRVCSKMKYSEGKHMWEKKVEGEMDVWIHLGVFIIKSEV